MKKIISILVVCCAMITAKAQLRSENYFAHKWLIELNAPIGVTSQTPTVKYTPNFQNALNASNFDNLKIAPGVSYGFDGEFGCYFGKLKLYGFGSGLIFQTQNAQMSLDNYHVEYKDVDASKTTFRQVVTATQPITENLKKTMVNIPIVFKIKQLFTKRIGITADAGLLINFTNYTNYTSSSSFNYEAIYSYLVKTNDAYTHIYDNNPTPSANDWLITQQQYENHNTGSPAAELAYFDSLRARGYKVGLNINPTQNSGKVIKPGGALGFIFRPAVNYKVAERLFFYLGGYMSYQIFNTKVASDYKLVDNFGTKYNSMLNTISQINNFSLGVNVGFRVFLGQSNIYVEGLDDY